MQLQDWASKANTRRRLKNYLCVCSLRTFGEGGRDMKGHLQHVQEESLGMGEVNLLKALGREIPDSRCCVLSWRTE